MWPFHVGMGPLAISPVELFAFLGVAITASLARKRMAPAPGVSWIWLVDLGLAATVGGAVGSRLFYFIPHWITGLERGGSLVSAWSEGAGFWGALFGGMTGLALMARWKKLPFLPVWDAVAAKMPFGFTSGKLGCFLAGCCYGPRCDGALGISFVPGSLAYQTQRAAGLIPAGAPRALPVHPTQVYEVVLVLALFGMLAWVQRRSRRPGETTLAWFSGYAVTRFVVEFFRDDPGRHGFGSSLLSDSQITSIVVVAASGVFWSLLRRREPAASPS